jgi:hypothetical protein
MVDHSTDNRKTRNSTLPPAIKKRYTGKEILDLLQEANRRGLDLSAGSPLENLTLAELDRLLRDRG